MKPEHGKAAAMTEDGGRRRGYGVAIIGAGLEGGRRARVVRELEGCRVRVVADIDEGAARALAEEVGCPATTSCEEALKMEGVDVVAVCTPPHLHALISRAALARGRHVLCEKPMGRSVDEARALVEASAAGGRRLKCGLNHRHHPGVRQAKLWQDEGAIGEVVFARCRYGIGGRAGYDREWRARPEVSGGGQLIDQGFHGLDLLRWFVGDFVEAFGMLSSGFWDMPVEDNAFALLRTARGQVASLHASWTQWRNLFSLEVFGRDGYVRVEGLGGGYGVERAALGRRDFGAPFREEVIEYGGPDVSFRDEWRELLSAIGEDREPLGSGLDALKTQELVRAVYRSAAAAGVVRLGGGGGQPE